MVQWFPALQSYSTNKCHNPRVMVVFFSSISSMLKRFLVNKRYNIHILYVTILTESFVSPVLLNFPSCPIIHLFIQSLQIDLNQGNNESQCTPLFSLGKLGKQPEPLLRFYNQQTHPDSSNTGVENSTLPLHLSIASPFNGCSLLHVDRKVELIHSEL